MAVEIALLLPFGLLRNGQVKLRKIDGWQQTTHVARAA
jgi:hypothetical protein